MENVPQVQQDSALAAMFTADGKLLVPGMTCIYPIDKDRSYDMPTQLFITAMLKFYKVLTPNGSDDISIFTFKGIAGSEDLLWVRFETPTGPASFVVLESNAERWVQACLEDETLGWCTQGNLNKAMQARDMHLNVSKAIFELPMSYFMVPFEAHPMDELFSGDYEVYENAIARLKVSVWDRLREITDYTAALNVSVKHKDHDLYLVFKATPDFAKMNVILEKVSPILPESGEISLGDNLAALFVPDEGDKRTKLTIKKIMVLGKQINYELEKTRKLISQHAIIQAEYAQFVKTMLLAATHFMKLVYKFRGDDGVELVEVEADKILRALKEHGGNVGLDLNSWIVWEYDGLKQPVRVTAPELCFNDLLHAKFTESFIEALYAHLMGLGNPLTRPYHYREEVDVNDGIEVGSVRRV